MNGTVKRLEEQPQTLVQLLRRRALDQPNQIGYSFLLEGEETEEVSLSYGELDAAARSIAARILSYARAGDRVLLLYPPGLEYLAAFFGCLYAGVIAVPAYPPRHNRTLARLQALATATILARMSELCVTDLCLQSMRWLATDDVNMTAAAVDEWREAEVQGETLAFLQYTSGSTGVPKGVMLTHENLLHNAKLVYEACE